jgi:hypothetical protein
MGTPKSTGYALLGAVSTNGHQDRDRMLAIRTIQAWCMGGAVLTENRLILVYLDNLRIPFLQNNLSYPVTLPVWVLPSVQGPSNSSNSILSSQLKTRK